MLNAICLIKAKYRFKKIFVKKRYLRTLYYILENPSADRFYIYEGRSTSK